MTRPAPTQADMLQAFALLDERLAAAANPKPLLGLRERLAGELLGDSERAMAPISEEFELVTHAGAATTRTSYDELVAGLRQLEQARGDLVIWVELVDLVNDGDIVAAHGLLRTLMTPAAASVRYGKKDVAPDDRYLATSPLAFFIRYAGDQMVSEELYMDPAATELSVVTGAATPSLGALRAEVDGSSGDRVKKG